MNRYPVSALRVGTDRIITFFFEQSGCRWLACAEEGEVVGGRDLDMGCVRQAAYQIVPSRSDISGPQPVRIPKVDQCDPGQHIRQTIRVG